MNTEPYPPPDRGETCLMPIDERGERCCGKPATKHRKMGFHLTPLCDEHAAELDSSEE